MFIGTGVGRWIYRFGINLFRRSNPEIDEMANRVKE